MVFNKKEENSSSGNTMKTKVTEPEVSNTSNNAKVNSPSKFSYSKTKEFFKNERNQYVFGFVLMFLGVYLLVSFISYFFSWKADQDQIKNWSNFGKEAFANGEIAIETPQNKAGSIGAKLSHLFIHKLFGVTSFIFPILFIFIGIKLTFKKTWFSLTKAFRILFFYAILFSSGLSLIFSNSQLNPGGNFGYQLNQWLIFVLGQTGLIIGLILGLIISLVLFFSLRLDQMFAGMFAKSLKEDETIVPMEQTVDNDIQIETKSEINTFRTVYPTERAPIVEPIINQEEKVVIPTEEKKNELIIEKAFEEPIEEPIDEDDQFEDQEPYVAPIKAEDVIFQIEPKKIDDDYDGQIIPADAGEYDPTLDLSSYQFPTIELLDEYEINNETAVSTETLEANKNNIIETLKNYKIEIASIKATIGPTVTLYEIVPAAGVRIAKIKNLEDDIALSLAALGIRIVAPIPGKGTIGIEVPNPNPDVVSMRTVLASKAFNTAKMDLPIALGKTINNETFVVDLAKMPHLLMAGATGQGKSVGLNCILVSLLYKKHPSQLKLVLVDPKKVELTLFNKIVRHFLAKLPGDDDAIITETKKVVNTLNSLCVEMDERYKLLQNASCRNLKEYNAKFVQRRLNPEKGHRFLPYIVLVVDEFADLIMTAGKEVELPIARLAQLARAIGIHLIIATQRPSVNIITGTIKANFPARIAFRVTSKIDSRTILDAGGADQLIGRGDMLLSTGNDIIRIQCAFVDTHEVERITQFIGEQRGYPDAFILPEYNDGNDSGGGGGNDLNLEDRDELFVDAARIVVLHQQGSASLLQRKLKLGYNRAGRIVDQLETAGIIGPFEGSKARQVLISDENSLEQYLNYGNEKK